MVGVCDMTGGVRVVSLLPAATEMLCAIGAGNVSRVHDNFAVGPFHDE